MKKIISFLILISFFSSCDVDDTFKLVKFENKFSLEVIDSMEESNDLNEDASLQYQNSSQEIFTIVIEENIKDLEELIDNKLIKDFSLDVIGYTNLIKENFENNPSITKVSPTKDLIIDGNKAKSFEIEGKVENINICYLVTIIKGRNTFYQITSWTLLSKKEKNIPKFEKIAQSFKEIKTKTIAK